MTGRRVLRLVAGLSCLCVAVAAWTWPPGGAPAVAQGYGDSCGVSGASDWSPRTEGRQAKDFTNNFLGAVVGALAGAAGVALAVGTAPAWAPVAIGAAAAMGAMAGFNGAQGCGPSQPCPACNAQPPGNPIYAPDLYLYPERAETVHVVLGGTVTASRPAYGGSGWTVRATPDGQLLDGAAPLGHLFYEARAEAPWQAASGWVVSAAAWPGWIASQLPRLGLNATETADFARDWSTDLPPAPYYLVAPQPPALVNAAMPLQIAPRPDTLYRLWLYIVPLQGPVAVPPPQWAAPVRRGFTAVEWGVLFPPGVMPPCAPEVGCPA